MTVPTVSKREALMEYIVTKILAMTTADYSQTYRVVTRDPISVEEVSKLQAGESLVGVYDLDEEKTRQFNQTTCKLQVMIEFYYVPKLGQIKAKELNRILADLTKVMMVDYNQGGNAINTQEVSNNIDIDGIFDKLVNGSIRLEVTYRHGFADPYKDNC